jgi:hypothetical protein
VNLAAAALAAAIALLAAAPLTACSSGTPRPSWCAPLVAQWHAKETRQAYLDELTALARQGAPVSELIADESAFARDNAVANIPGIPGFSALASAPAALGKVAADLQRLNAECGQPGESWKSDNV